MKKIKARRVSAVPPIPKLARKRMSKKKVWEEYVRPIEYLAKYRSPRIILYKKSKKAVKQ